MGSRDGKFAVWRAVFQRANTHTLMGKVILRNWILTDRPVVGCAGMNWTMPTSFADKIGVIQTN